jgi:hypothetical protein
MSSLVGCVEVFETSGRQGEPCRPGGARGAFAAKYRGLQRPIAIGNPTGELPVPLSTLGGSNRPGAGYCPA